MAFMSFSKKGISASELQRQMGIRNYGYGMVSDAPHKMSYWL
jgi:hypothetical protein